MPDMGHIMHGKLACNAIAFLNAILTHLEALLNDIEEN